MPPLWTARLHLEIEPIRGQAAREQSFSILNKPRLVLCDESGAILPTLAVKLCHSKYEWLELLQMY